MDNGNACFYLSGMYMSGSMFRADNTKTPSNTTASEKPANEFVLEKDMKKAFAFSTKACELKNFYACANLSRSIDFLFHSFCIRLKVFIFLFHSVCTR